MSNIQLRESSIKNFKFGTNIKLVKPVNIYDCEIGNICVIAHGVMFINDLFKRGKPACGDKNLWNHTDIKNNVFNGSNATILPVNICDNVVIDAGSVVTKDITKSGVYAGNPAKLLRKI